MITGRDQHDTAPSSAGSALKGPDLARAALEAARAAARARGRGRPRRSVIGRGAPPRRRGWSGARPDDRDPQPLGRLAARLAAERGWSQRLAGGQVFGRWAHLVGPDVAEHAKPVVLREGELTVQASSTAWATQLRLLQRQLLQRIAASVGPDVVKRIKVQGPAAPNWRKGRLHIPGRGPRDTYG
ncbi:DciA family protein [Longimycelium tulufanense]|nr:DciA family protein [Longimycelium tulufanense]